MEGVGVSPFDTLYTSKSALKPRYLYLRKPLSKRKPQSRIYSKMTMSVDEVNSCLACLMESSHHLISKTPRNLDPSINGVNCSNSINNSIVQPGAIIANGMTAGEFCVQLINCFWQRRFAVEPCSSFSSSSSVARGHCSQSEN